ncbi:MAG: tRNA preQ1(34) S-adenosylmethionine ribosyltransferase-isomerase QueA, partial [bacterium]
DLKNTLKTGDIIVLNNSKVIPARLLGHKETGGKIELFLLTKIKAQTWQCLIKGKIQSQQKIILPKNIIATAITKDQNGENQATWQVKFNVNDKKLFTVGETPLPPYIKAKSRAEEYQTVYAKPQGSVAAPTAGLHFTKKLIADLKKRGIKFLNITLHVGLGTFAPVKTEKIIDHQIHSELAIVDNKTATAINKAKTNGQRIIACGTTAMRTLEAFTNTTGQLQAGKKWVNIFIYPGYQFRLVDVLITNFHLPKSTLLMLISAFATRDIIMHAYAEAIKKKYRFFSFGDAMLIQ